MIKTINSIEISSVCNNTCAYCPASVQHKYRPTGHMTHDTFFDVIMVVKALCEKGTQKELNLFGIGEPTLNPDLIKMIQLARKMLPFGMHLHLNTNGKTMTHELAVSLKDSGLKQIDITAHSLEDAGRAIYCLESVGVKHRDAEKNEHVLKYAVSIDPLTKPNNWAGLVDWSDCGIRYKCPWITNQQAYVFWDGDVSTCCLNAFKFNGGTHGNIKNYETIELKPFQLCGKCHQRLEA